MNNATKLFHYVSYLQYPLMAIGLYFCYKPFIFGQESLFTDYNKALTFMGLGISFATLQDTTKTQNKISKRIWENPKYARIFLLYISLLILFIVGFGMYGLFFAKNPNVRELSFGTIILGIGFIGLLKSAVEMAENHGKKPNVHEMQDKHLDQ